LVLPIFYDVDPSDVRRQKGSFEEAFTNHELRYSVGYKQGGKMGGGIDRSSQFGGLGFEERCRWVSQARSFGWKCMIMLSLFSLNNLAQFLVVVYAI